MTVSAAHLSPKLHKPRSRKRRAEIESPSAESAAKQATPSGSVLLNLTTRAYTKSAAVIAVAAVAAASGVLKASSTLTHANLQQLALSPSLESLLSSQQPLQIAEPNASSELLAGSQPGRASTPRVQPPAPLAAASSIEPVIVLDDDETPPERTVELPLAEEDDWERAERASAQPALRSDSRVAAVQALTRSQPAPTAVSLSEVSTAAAHALLSTVTSVPCAPPLPTTSASFFAIASVRPPSAAAAATPSASAHVFSPSPARSPSFEGAQSQS